MSAALAVAACGQKNGTSDLTTLNGRVRHLDAQSVRLIVPGKLDTTILITDSTFSMKLPVNLLEPSSAESGNVKYSFISDGTKLDMVLEPSKDGSKVTSKTPEISVNDRYFAFNDMMRSYQERYREEVGAVDAQSGLSEEDKEAKKDEVYDAINSELMAEMKSSLDENKDNIIALTALNQLRYELPDAQLDSVLNTLGEAVKATPSVSGMRKSLDARLNTAEGKPFSDFEVAEDPEHPEKVTAKLSDYVGKGKYVLVDFWASWCGPCRREMPNLKSTYERFKGDNFDMLSVAVWDKPEDTANMAKELGINWNQITNSQRVATDVYGVESIPHIILFGPDGTILNRGLRGEDIPNTIASYLGE